MSASRSLLVLAAAAALALAVVAGAGADGRRFGIGVPVDAELLRGWDIDVEPDGGGLPDGRGSALEGEPVFMERCAACHGEFGEGAGRYPPLMGGVGTLASHDPVKTVGSYWSHATTLWDYVNRAMPFGDAQSLQPDEVYAVVAYVLYLNDLVAEDQVLDRDSLAAIKMPNAGGFFDDPRPDTPAGDPCMRNCVAEVRILGKAKRLEVTPEAEQRQSD